MGRGGGGGGREDTRMVREWEEEGGDFRKGREVLQVTGMVRPRVGMTPDIKNNVGCDKGVYGFWCQGTTGIFDIQVTNLDADKYCGPPGVVAMAR